jgi:PAS domain S-box-containing protein
VGSVTDRSGSSFERELREVNEALLVSSVHQHELTEQAQHAEAALRKSEAELRLTAEELTRFNRLAVGRESRIIELKVEINELAQRLGEPLRYSLELEPARSDSATELPTQEDDEELRARARGDIVPLETVLCTEELTDRPSRPPGYEIENDALISLMRALVDSPGDVLQVLAQKILEVLRADSAGISLLTADAKRFYWPAIAGLWEPHIGGGTPRDFGPCGDVLDRNAPLLFGRLERRYAYFRPVTPAVEEALLVPFYVAGNAVGTLWAVSHGDRKFDNEDLRQLKSLGRFASAAYQTGQVRTLEGSRRAAALNLMEDLVQSRQVTERVNAELRASEERYRALFNSIDEAFCVVEVLFDTAGHPTDYRFLETNPAFEKQSGLHDAVGRRMRELAPHHEAYWFEKYGHVALTGESIRFVNEAQELGNRWFDVYAFRLGMPERHRVAILFSDISDRKRVAQALQDSEVRYRRIFECAQDGIVILDVDGAKITEANPYMVQMLGYSSDELLGKELWQIGLQRDVHGSRSMVQELQENGFVRYEHLPLRTKDGQQIEVEVVATLYQEGGKPVIQCNMHDITERTHLEQKTQEQAHSLADLNRRKDEFLAMLSHELRNPLASIQNAAHLLRLQRDQSPIQTKAHGMIERQVSQLARLVDDLLEVSRISTGRVRLRTEAVDLRGIVQHACETTRPQTDQKAQSLSKSLPDEPLWASGDPVRLEQVAVNLLNNASKYTDRGGQISVTLQREDDEAVLRVRDNGVGIAPEMLPRIFDLFTQADRSLDRAQGGLGIGLALVQSLVTMHRGRVEARSTVGQGSEFVVRLPVLLSLHESAVVDEQSESTQTDALKVLVVDDNIDAAQSVSMLLQMLGHTTRLAHDGASALKCAGEFVPDVVLLDIGLPVADGFQVARWIREERTLSKVLIVALTGYGQEADKQRADAAGFDHHLVKPVDFAKIEDILSTVTRRPN